MPIAVLCPKCKQKLNAPDSMGGKKAKCPHCGQVMQLPTPAATAAPAPKPEPSQELFDDLKPTDPFSTADPSATTGAAAGGGLGLGSGFDAQQFDEMLADVGTVGDSMQCRNHPGTVAAGRCTGCNDAFCSDCLTGKGPQQYCRNCKASAVSRAPAPVSAARGTCPEAKQALTYAIVGIFCFGIILEPLAIMKALQARNAIAANPRMGGSGMATAALVIGIGSLILWALSIILQIAVVASQQ